MRGAHRLALATAQAVLDAVADGADVALLHDQRLMAHQAETGRVGCAQVCLVPRAGASQQLALVEAAFGVDALLVVGKGSQLGVAQEFELGDADAMLAADHAVEPPRQRHDARDDLMRCLQHRVVVAVDGNVGVHVAVTGMHVQRHPHAPTQHPLVNALCIPARSARRARPRRWLPAKAPGSASSKTRAACGPAAVRTACGRCRAAARRAGPARTATARKLRQQQPEACCTRSSSSSALAMPASLVQPAQRQGALAEEGFERLRQLDLVAQAELDVQPLDAFGVLAHARQRDHHVLVDLEGVGVLGNRRGALAVEPELLARLGTDRHEAFAVPRELAMRTTSLVARATAASGSSPTISPNSAIFGSPLPDVAARLRLLLVA